MALLIEETTSQTESQQTKSNVGFWYGEKTEKREEKPLRADKRTNKLNPRMTAGQGNQPEPHWWKASALTIALTFLSSIFPEVFWPWLQRPYLTWFPAPFE